MVPLVLLTVAPRKYSVPPSVASSVPVFEVRGLDGERLVRPPGDVGVDDGLVDEVQGKLMAPCPWIVLSSFTRVSDLVLPSR